MLKYVQYLLEQKRTNPSEIQMKTCHSIKNLSGFGAYYQISSKKVEIVSTQLSPLLNKEHDIFGGFLTTLNISLFCIAINKRLFELKLWGLSLQCVKYITLSSKLKKLT
jgi:hypothetical protein